MSETRRTLLCALGGAGLLLATTPALASEDAPAPVVGRAGVSLTPVGNLATVAWLDPLGPAARAGLRPGDVVLGCNGGGLDRLTALGGPPGEQVELIVRRGAVRRTVRLVLEEPESARP